MQFLQFSILSKNVLFTKLLSHAKGNALTWTRPPLSPFGRSRPAGQRFFHFCPQNVSRKCSPKPAGRTASRVGSIRDTTGTPQGHHRDTTGTPPGHHKDTTGTPPGHYRDTGTPPGHHRDTTGTPPGHHRDTTGTPTGTRRGHGEDQEQERRGEERRGGHGPGARAR